MRKLNAASMPLHNRVAGAGRIAIALALAAPLMGGGGLYAQKTFVPGHLYVTAAAQYYFIPSDPFERTWPGARLGGGWELPLGPGAAALGLEAGWTRTGLNGKHRPADTTELIPLMFRGGYGLPLGKKQAFMLRADLLAGALGGIEAGGFVVSFAAGARLNAEYRISGQWEPLVWSVFAGGGVDILPEKDKWLFLPDVEAGVKLRVDPGRTARRTMLARAGKDPRRVLLINSGKKGMVLSDYNIYFAEGGAEINKRGVAALDAVIRLLRKYPGTSVFVAGHAAREESGADSWPVSRGRTRAAADYLTQHGIDAERVGMGSYGAEIPAAPHDTPEGRARNRRVELIITEPVL